MRVGDILFWAFFSTATVVMVLGLMASYSADKEKIAFVDACETMGGVAVVGNYGTKACFKSEVLK